MRILVTSIGGNFSHDLIRALRKDCKKFKIKIIIPCSENECLVISKNLKKFEKLKIETSVSNYKITSMINDKHKVFEY